MNSNSFYFPNTLFLSLSLEAFLYLYRDWLILISSTQLLTRSDKRGIQVACLAPSEHLWSINCNCKQQEELNLIKKY